MRGEVRNHKNNEGDSGIKEQDRQKKRKEKSGTCQIYRREKDVEEISEQSRGEVQAAGFYRIHSSRNLIKFHN